MFPVVPGPAAPAKPIIPYRLLAIGGSAGAIPALIEIVSSLPAAFPIPVVVLQHPTSAAWPDMPSAAIDFGHADLMRSAAAIAKALEVLAARGVK